MPKVLVHVFGKTAQAERLAHAGLRGKDTDAPDIPDIGEAGGHLLKIVGDAGVVVDDDDEVDLMCLFVRSVIDVAEVVGIGLPESAKGILFKCLPVLPVQFP